MLFPENYPINPDDLLFIEFCPIEVPVFTIGLPPYANKDLVKQHHIRSIDVIPVLYERRTPEWYDGASDELPVHEMLLFFDPDEYPVQDYGLIVGDKGFEAHIARYISDILPRKRFGEVEYTSLNEQSDDYVSMRFPVGAGRGFSPEIRKIPEFFQTLSESERVRSIKLIKPLTAERYRQAIEPRRPEGSRPTPPNGLCAGMWITWGGPS